MRGRKKILYLMHVPWGWAKQRPHFIAEYLAKSFDVSVFYEKQYTGKRNWAVENDTSVQLKVRQLFKLPFPDRKWFRKMNEFLMEFQLKLEIGESDIIWLTSPNLFPMLKAVLPPAAKVVYDCMDNVLEFPRIKSDPDLRRATFNNEKGLTERGDIIFASSDYLKGKLLERYGIKKEICVVNNAIYLDKKDVEYWSPNRRLPLKVVNIFKKKGINLTYIGTVSEWMDIDLLLESLERFKNINYIIWGPCEIKLPEHERLVHCGPIEHKYIFDIMDKSDALIMPFKINELVRSINPIKLYEYIYGYKPSIVAEYDETLKFEDFVHLYRDREDFFSLLKKLIENNLHPKRSREDHKLFAEDNTWDKRIKLIVDKLIQK